MTQHWRTFPGLEIVEKSFSEPWRLVLDFFEEVNLLKLAAEGEWEALPGISPLCGPDGLAGIVLARDELVAPSFRLGALIGKLGGSSAGIEAPSPPAEGDHPQSPPAAFAIGTGCVLAIPSGMHGPLFISFNSRARPLMIKRLNLSISGTTVGT